MDMRMEIGKLHKTLGATMIYVTHDQVEAMTLADKIVVLKDGEIIEIGSHKLEVWHTPGHTDSQLAFRMGSLLLSGDNIYRDGSVGAIDAHHGSDIPAFIRSLERIAASDVEWLLPSHGPIFKKDDRLLAKTLERLRGYLQLADFGTCAQHWPLIEEWDRELAEGATCKDYLQVRREGDRDVQRSLKHYNLDVIISVGYRVKSHRGVQFRVWATQQLRDYLVKGFVLNDEKFKQGKASNYFDQLLVRIRDIRSSE
jgi:hypothetical protein